MSNLRTFSDEKLIWLLLQALSRALDTSGMSAGRSLYSRLTDAVIGLVPQPFDIPEPPLPPDALIEEADRRYAERVSSGHDEQLTGIQRIGDMHHAKSLRITVQPDGDVIVSIAGEYGVIEGATGSREDRRAEVQFCTSGGRSPHTRRALFALLRAMDKDNEKDPMS